VAGVLVTPWHPVTLPAEAGGEWVFPCRASQQRVRYTGCIYSVMLQKDTDVDSHAIMLGGGEASDGASFWGVTLGHGMLRGSDPRGHLFFGDYERVASSLKRCKHASEGRFLTGGTKRSMRTGLVTAFATYRGSGGPSKSSRIRVLAKRRCMHGPRRLMISRAGRLPYC